MMTNCARVRRRGAAAGRVVAVGGQAEGRARRGQGSGAGGLRQHTPNRGLLAASAGQGARRLRRRPPKEHGKRQPRHGRG